MELPETIMAQIERDLFKFSSYTLGIAAAFLLIAASFLGSIAADAIFTFWKTLNSDEGVRYFWPHGAVTGILTLELSVFAVAIGISATTLSRAFVARARGGRFFAH